MKLKVIQLTGSLIIGGAETIVKEYALNLDKEKFDCIVVLLSEKKNTILEKQLIDNGIKVFFLGEKKLLASNNFIAKIANFIYKVYSFRKFIKNEKPDIIHTHQAVNRYLLSINTKKMNIKLFHTYHTEIHRYIKNYRDYKFATKYCIHHRDMIPIALHEKMKNDSNSIFRTNKTIIINNGIEFERFRNPKKSREIVLKELNIEKDSFVIGHVGRFHKVKNHEFIIKVFYEVQKIKPDSYLLLIGEGELMGNIKQLVNKFGIQRKVKFLGNRGDIPDLLNSMDAFIFPSIVEGFPVSLIEAQAAGLRCVISNNITKSAILTENTIALSLDDPIELWGKCLLDKSWKGKAYGRIEDFDIRKSIKALESIYLDIASVFKK